MCCASIAGLAAAAVLDAADLLAVILAEVLPSPQCVTFDTEYGDFASRAEWCLVYHAIAQ